MALFSHIINRQSVCSHCRSNHNAKLQPHSNMLRNILEDDLVRMDQLQKRCWEDWENSVRSRLEQQGKLTPEEKKPEWLRGVTGAGPTPKANWVPANSDGTPKLGD